MDTTEVTVDVPPGYEELFEVLMRALNHAARDKGAERHAMPGQRFLHQPIMQITRRYGMGFAAGQIEKKLDESVRMVQRAQLDAAQAEILGVINYAAALILYIEEGKS